MQQLRDISSTLAHANSSATSLPSSEGWDHRLNVGLHMLTHPHLPLVLAHILLALWVWLSNSTQMLNLLLDPVMRRQPRTALIINISIADLMVAGLLCPLYTDSLLRGPWRHGVVTCSMYEVVFHLQVCVSSLAVLVMNVERFYFMLSPRMLHGKGIYRMTALLTAIPWVVGLILVVPLYAHGARATLITAVGSTHRTCLVVWDHTLYVMTIFACFLAPSFLLLVSTVTVLLLYVISAFRTPSSLPLVGLQRSRTRGIERWLTAYQQNGYVRGEVGRLEERGRRECVLAVAVSSILTIGFHFPLFVVLLLRSFCRNSSTFHPASDACEYPDTVWAAVMMIGMSKSGIIPLVWLLFSDVRAGMRLSACACTCWMKGLEEDSERLRRRSLEEGGTGSSLFLQSSSPSQTTVCSSL